MESRLERTCELPVANVTVCSNGVRWRGKNRPKPVAIIEYNEGWSPNMELAYTIGRDPNNSKIYISKTKKSRKGTLWGGNVLEIGKLEYFNILKILESSETTF